MGSDVRADSANVGDSQMSGNDGGLDSGVADDVTDPADSGVEQDSGAIDDVPTADVVTTTDTGVPRDTGVAMDVTTPRDTGVAMDVTPPRDTGVVMDVPSPRDTGVVMDVTPPRDTGVLDSGVVFRSSTRQTARMLPYRGSPSGFYEYLPPNYDPMTRVPLLVFWHGIGENGNGTTELSRVLANGPPRLINRDQWPATRPFVVLSPQHPGGGCPTAGEIRAFIAWAMMNYAVDPARIYLTGLSCGAIGSWNYLGANTDMQVIAAVLIAGDGRGAWGSQMCNLGRVAIWGFHGDADGVVSPDGTRIPMNNLIACPSPPRRDARLTMYPGVGHDSWSRTYDGSAGHDIYTWLLSQRR
jgi:hypothetical protein